MDIITKYNQTGPCTIDIEKVSEKWNRLWWVYLWKPENKYRLIKYKRKDGPETALKVTISEDQAKELIEKLNLAGTPNPAFKNAVSYRKEYIELCLSNIWKVGEDYYFENALYKIIEKNPTPTPPIKKAYTKGSDVGVKNYPYFIAEKTRNVKTTNQ